MVAILHVMARRESKSKLISKVTLAHAAMKGVTSIEGTTRERPRRLIARGNVVCGQAVQFIKGAAVAAFLNEEIDMRFHFEDRGHEAGFVWLRIGKIEVIEVTSGLGSSRTRTEFQIRNAPINLESQIIVCRKAIAQFIRESTGSKEMSISIFDDSIEPWKGQLFAITPLDDHLDV